MCVIMALCVILAKTPVSSALSLIGMMLVLAGVFAQMHAHFIAILQVIIYAGAIMVLFMFVIMLLNLKTNDTTWMSRGQNTALTAVAGVLGVVMVYYIIDAIFAAKLESPQTISDTFGTVATVGEILFTKFVLPFEVASILLLTAMIGAVVLAKTKVD
jgi:NADH-quinone oxidoreductase subunit J